MYTVSRKNIEKTCVGTSSADGSTAGTSKKDAPPATIAKGHSIVFPQDSEQVMATELPALDTAKMCQIMFMGPEGTKELIIHGHPTIKENLQVHPKNIDYLLERAQIVNSVYKQENIKSKIKPIEERNYTTLVNDADDIIVKGPNVDNFLINKINDTAGNDVAGVRTAGDGLQPIFLAPNPITKLDILFQKDSKDVTADILKTETFLKVLNKLKCPIKDSVHVIVASTDATSTTTTTDAKVTDADAGDSNDKEQYGLDGISSMAPKPTNNSSSSSSSSSRSNKPIKISREENPWNEFTQMNELILTSFPFLFCLGTGWDKKASVDMKYIRHLLLQHDQRFSQSMEFVFYICNVIQRHAMLKEVKAKAVSNQGSFQDLLAFANDPNIEMILSDCVKEPESENAKKYFKLLNNVLQFGNSKVPCSTQERSSALSKLYSMIWKMGLPSWFISISPDDTRHLLIVRLNHGEHHNELDENGNHFIEQLIDDPSLYNLYKEAVDNPVTCAHIFDHIVKNVLEHLFQLPDESTSRKSACPPGMRPKSLFGNVTAYFAVVENNARQSLHIHVAVYGSIPPTVLGVVAQYPNWTKLASMALDTMVKSEVSPAVRLELNNQIKNLKRKENPIPLPTFAYLECPNPTDKTDLSEHYDYYRKKNAEFVAAGSVHDQDDYELGKSKSTGIQVFQARGEAIQLRVGNHTSYVYSCTTTKSGKYGCRFGFSRGMNDGNGVVELEEVPIDGLASSSATVDGINVVSAGAKLSSSKL
jgi:hypothetical protein